MLEKSADILDHQISVLILVLSVELELLSYKLLHKLFIGLTCQCLL